MIVILISAFMLAESLKPGIQVPAKLAIFAFTVAVIIDSLVCVALVKYIKS